MGVAAVEGPAARVAPLHAVVVSSGAAGVFFALARSAGEAAALAVWGGAVWVFLLSMIVTLPLLAARRERAAKRPARPRDRSSMMLALAVWLCTLPFIFLLVVPWLGTRAAVTTALLLLAGISFVCWSVCAWSRSTDAEGFGR